jgi:hypothetical protein
MITELEKRILEVFDEYIFGFMRSDIQAAINGNANYLAALGLVSYTEVLGGLVTGNLGLDRHSGRNFNAFIPYLGKDYEALQQANINLYNVVRCGLVHSYFIKGESTIIMHAKGPCGIVSSVGGPTYFYVSIYSDHLFAGATRFRNDILEGKSPSLAENFETAMKRIAVWA